jgi:hypothetical protein
MQLSALVTDPVGGNAGQSTKSMASHRITKQGMQEMTSETFDEKFSIRTPPGFSGIRAGGQRGLPHFGLRAK